MLEGSARYCTQVADKNPHTGGRIGTLADIRSNAISASIISGVWNGAGTETDIDAMPCLSRSAFADTMPSRLPAITVCFVELRCVTYTASPADFRIASTSCIAARIDNSPPGTRICDITALARCFASSIDCGNVVTSAASEAVNSPKLCPSTASGRRPSAFRVSIKAADTPSTHAWAHHTSTPGLIAVLSNAVLSRGRLLAA